MFTPQVWQPRPTALHLLLHLHESNQALSLSFHFLLLLYAYLSKTHKTTRWAFGFPQSFDPLIFPLQQVIGLHVTCVIRKNWSLRSLFSPEGFSRLPIISHCVRAWDIFIARCAHAYITQCFFLSSFMEKAPSLRFSHTYFKWHKSLHVLNIYWQFKCHKHIWTYVSTGARLSLFFCFFFMWRAKENI